MTVIILNKMSNAANKLLCRYCLKIGHLIYIGNLSRRLINIMHQLIDVDGVILFSTESIQGFDAKLIGHYDKITNKDGVWMIRKTQKVVL